MKISDRIDKAEESLKEQGWDVKGVVYKKSNHYSQPSNPGEKDPTVTRHILEIVLEVVE